MDRKCRGVVGSLSPLINPPPLPPHHRPAAAGKGLTTTHTYTARIYACLLSPKYMLWNTWCELLQTVWLCDSSGQETAVRWVREEKEEGKVNPGQSRYPPPLNYLFIFRWGGELLKKRFKNDKVFYNSAKLHLSAASLSKCQSLHEFSPDSNFPRSRATQIPVVPQKLSLTSFSLLSCMCFFGLLLFFACWDWPRNRVWSLTEQIKGR